jgi:hypothetical protein
MDSFVKYINEAKKTNIQTVKRESYGQELIIDMHDVPTEFFTKKNIRQFAEQLCDEIKMKKALFIYGVKRKIFIKLKLVKVLLKLMVLAVFNFYIQALLPFMLLMK